MADDNPYLGAKIVRAVDFQSFVGIVREVWTDKSSGDILYRVVYLDGDVEDLDHSELLMTLQTSEPAVPPLRTNGRMTQCLEFEAVE